MNFTDRRIQGLAKPRHPKLVLEPGGRGDGRLALRLLPSGTRKWAFVWHEAGAQRSHTLGDYPTLSISDARIEAARLSKAYRDSGGDGVRLALGLPAAENEGETASGSGGEASAPDGSRRRSAPPAPRYGTLAQALDAYYGDMRRRGKRSADDVKRQMDIYLRNYEELLAKQARDVTAEDIVEVVRAAHQRGPVVGDRVLAIFKAALKTAAAADLDPTAPTQGRIRWGLTVNVAAAIPRNSQATRVRDRWLKADEWLAVWQWWNGDGDAADGEWDSAMPEVSRRLLVLTMLSGQRAGEMRRLRVEDVDVDGRTFRIAPENHKTGKGNTLPMTERMVPHFKRLLELVADGALGAGWLTPGRTMNKVLEQPMGVDTLGKALMASIERLNAARRALGLPAIEAFQPRDIRRSFASLYSTLPRADLIALNLLQGHALPEVSAVAQKHYIKSDHIEQKRKVLGQFDRWIEGFLHGGKNMAKVTELRRVAE